MIDRLLRLISPHICCCCGEVGAILCPNCKNDITEEAYSACIGCLAPAALSNLCGSCRRKAAYDEAWVVGERTGPLKRLIDAYKFERAYEGAEVLVDLLDARLPIWPEGGCVTYIPDIASHRRQRGSDHMAIVARGLARRRMMAYDRLLERRTSLSQRGSTQADRLVRQRGAFAARNVPDDTPIVLIDDIYTTGATIAAAVAALREATMAPIYIVCLARQPFADHRKARL